LNGNRTTGQSRGNASAASRQTQSETAEGNLYLEHVDLTDLHDPVKSGELPLHIGESQRLFESTPDATVVHAPAVDYVGSLALVKQGLGCWSADLSQLNLEKKASDQAVLQMTEGIQAKLSIQLISADLPEQLLSQMSTCQTAANEFLRQFWVSLFPAVQDLRSPNFNKFSDQRESKAAKMIAYLQTTREKVKALLALAAQLNIDPVVVETAMQPLMTSVQHAVRFYQQRKTA